MNDILNLEQVEGSHGLRQGQVIIAEEIRNSPEIYQKLWQPTAAVYQEIIRALPEAKVVWFGSSAHQALGASGEPSDIDLICELDSESSRPDIEILVQSLKDTYSESELRVLTPEQDGARHFRIEISPKNGLPISIVFAGISETLKSVPFEHQGVGLELTIPPGEEMQGVIVDGTDHLVQGESPFQEIKFNPRADALTCPWAWWRLLGRGAALMKKGMHWDQADRIELGGEMQRQTTEFFPHLPGLTETDEKSIREMIANQLMAACGEEVSETLQAFIFRWPVLAVFSPTLIKIFSTYPESEKKMLIQEDEQSFIEPAIKAGAGATGFWTIFLKKLCFGLKKTNFVVKIIDECWQTWPYNDAREHYLKQGLYVDWRDIRGQFED